MKQHKHNCNYLGTGNINDCQCGALTSPEISTEKVGAQTPRTDKQPVYYVTNTLDASYSAVDIKFARQLERELNEAREQLETMKQGELHEIAVLKAKVERLSALTKQPEGIKTAEEWKHDTWIKISCGQRSFKSIVVEIQQNAITATRAEMEKEIEQLKAQLLEWQTIGSDEKMQKEMAELLKDKERLDWFDNAWQGLTIDYQPKQYQKFLLIHIITKEILGLGATLRQAIDAAIARQG